MLLLLLIMIMMMNFRSKFLMATKVFLYTMMSEIPNLINIYRWL